MKAIINYIFFFIICVAHPCNALSLEAKQRFPFDDSVKKIQQENIITSDDSQSTTVFFEDDLLDEDNEITSIKEKTFFVNTACFDKNPNTLSCFSNNLNTNFYSYTGFPHLPLSGFISFRALRL